MVKNKKLTIKKITSDAGNLHETVKSGAGVGLSETVEQKEENAQKDLAEPNYRNDFDDVFKSMKYRNVRLFIPVINESFGRNYSKDDEITILPSEGDITKITAGHADIHSRTSDFIIRIKDELYMLECQSYHDGTMEIRIAEYAFIFASRSAVWENGRVTLQMPNYCVIYIRNNKSTPTHTSITFQFPDGQRVNYDAKNVIIAKYTKEEIMEKDLYPYIPYYILRYEEQIKKQAISVKFLEEELRYFSDGLLKAVKAGKLDMWEMNNIKAFTNKIIEHFTHGEKKERLVRVMGGSIITTEADLIHDAGYAEGISRGREEGREEGRKEGRMELLFDFVQRKVISAEDAARQVDLTVEDFNRKMEIYRQS